MILHTQQNLKMPTDEEAGIVRHRFADTEFQTKIDPAIPSNEIQFRNDLGEILARVVHIPTESQR